MSFSFPSLPSWLRQPLSKLLSQGGILLLGAGAGVLFGSASAFASEEIILTYGPFAQSVAVKDLETFAETGQMSPSIRFLVNITNQDPEEVRKALTQELGVGMVFLSDVLNTLPGEYLLFEAGQIVHTKSRRANIQSLRGALVLSAYGDDKISLLEVFQNYPTQQMYIDGKTLANTASKVIGFIDRAEERLEVPLAIFKDFLESLICECESSQNINTGL
ncbi:MAG: alpha/beta hydrolase [Xenococcaceae cyanobacterium]